MVLNYLWTRLPLSGSLAWRVNLLSAVFAALAAWLFFVLARRLSGNAAAAVLSTWAVFLGRRVWAASTDAEVYALNLAWVAGLVLLGYEWKRTRRPGLLVALLFGYGLSFGNHPSMIVLLPALFWLVVSTDPRKLVQVRWIATAAAAVMVGLAQYGYILWRANSGAVYLEMLRPGAGLADLPPFMFAARFGDRVFMGGWDGLLFAGLGRVMSEANVQFLLPALLFAGAGGALLWRQDRRFVAFIAIGALSYGTFAAGYEIPDWEVYCLPIWLFLGWLIAVALAAAMEAPAPRRIALVGTFALSLAVSVAFNFAALQIEEVDVHQPLLIEAARDNAVLVTHAEEGDYHAIQTDNYFRLGLGLEETNDLRFVSAERAFYEEGIYLTDSPMFVADPASLQYFTDAGIDVVSDSPNGTLNDWVAALPPRSIVGVAINDIGSDRLRREIAAALRPLGLGSALLASGDPFYVGFGAKGPLRGIEVTHAEAAILDVVATDRRLGSIVPSLPARFPEAIQLGATVADRRLQTSLIAAGDVDIERHDGMRLFLFEGGGFRDFHVDSGHGTALQPAYSRTGAVVPVRTLAIVPRPAFPPAVIRDTGELISRNHLALEAAVIGCRDRRVKVIRTFDYASGGRGLESLAAFVPDVMSGDWLLISARGPIPAASQAPLGRALAAMGIGSIDVPAIQSSLFAAARVDTARSVVHALVDIDQAHAIELGCDG